MYKPCGYCNAMAYTPTFAKARFTAVPGFIGDKLYTIIILICVPLFAFSWPFGQGYCGQSLKSRSTYKEVEPIPSAFSGFLQQQRPLTGVIRPLVTVDVATSLVPIKAGARLGGVEGATLGLKREREPPRRVGRGGSSQGSVTQ